MRRDHERIPPRASMHGRTGTTRSTPRGRRSGRSLEYLPLEGSRRRPRPLDTSLAAGERRIGSCDARRGDAPGPRLGRSGRCRLRAMALVEGLVAFAGAKVGKAKPLRLRLLVGAAASSHGLLDALTDGGLGSPFLLYAAPSAETVLLMAALGRFCEVDVGSQGPAIRPSCSLSRRPFEPVRRWGRCQSAVPEAPASCPNRPA